MLPSAARLRRQEDFTAAVRRGARAGRGALVVHRLAGAGPSDSTARVGFVVGRTVGNSVRRHEVTRRLRHLMRDRLVQLDPDDRVVVRAGAAAAGRSSTALGADLDAALRKLRTRR